MNVFIDTNVLLDFYRMSSGDLDELRQLRKLVDCNRIRLLVSDVVQDEFSRNRERVIAQALSQFKKSRFELFRPNIVRSHEELAELEMMQRRVKELVDAVVLRVTNEADARTTAADKLIRELFSAVDFLKVSPEIINLGIRRNQLHNPPGKKDSCGDAIHWEWLLETVQQGETLHIVSRDGEFASPLLKDKLDSHLLREWKSRKSSECRLYQSLSELLNEHFGDIRLTDQIAKFAAIEKLERSYNFTTTHNAIASLMQFDDFTTEELQRIIGAYRLNSQIYWILDDDDVREFAHKIVTIAYSVGLEDEVFPLEEMLNDLDLQEAL